MQNVEIGDIGMKTIGLLAVILFVSFALVEDGQCAQAKIAVVDMSALIQALPDTSDAEAELEKTLKEFEEEQEKLIERLEVLKEEFKKVRNEAQDRVLNEDARADKMAAAEKKLLELKEFEIKARETAGLRQKQLAGQKERFRKRIISKIAGVVKKYADERDFTLVMDSAAVSLSGSMSVVYSNDEIDITKDILKLLKNAEKSKVSAE